MKTQQQVIAIDKALSVALGDKYSRDQVLAVYRKNRASHDDDCGTPIN